MSRAVAAILSVLLCWLPPLLAALARWLLPTVWPRPKSPRGLVLLSQVIWEDVWQRPQEHATHAAGRYPVLYLSPVQIHEWLLNLRGKWRPVRLSANGEMLVLSPLVWSGHYKSPLVFRWNMVLLRHWIHRVGGAWKPGVGCDVVINTPLLLPLWDELQRYVCPDAKLHYDVIDDFAGFPWAPANARALDAQLLQSCDTISTGTHQLAERLKGQRPDVTFVPLGVDFDHFHESTPEPADIAHLPRPRIGYFGTVGDRLDFALIGEVAAAFPNASVVIVGPLRVPRRVIPDYPNIHLLGHRPHEVLPGYAQAFDVGLIPFAMTEANKALNPVKTLEYLAAGVPVVSTDLPDVRRFYGTVVRVAQDHQAFVAEVGRLLESGRSDSAATVMAGFEVARARSWSAMAEALDAAMHRRLPNQASGGE